MLPQDPVDSTCDLSRALSIVARVGDLDPASRLAAAIAACREDAELRHQVQRLLTGQIDSAASPERPRGEFAGYALLEQVGEGTSGVVWRARQRCTGRIVALKLLKRDARGAATLRRFRREGELLAQMQHPGIARMLDAGHGNAEDGDEPYLTMELVDGPTLVDGANKAGVALRERIALLVQVCAALSYAHRRGVIHRDLKPDNIRLAGGQGQWQPIVLDFGIAAVHAAHSNQATLSGQVLGTLPYMAPDQLDGQIDARGDIYAIGAIGYELLTGQLPIDVRGLPVCAAIERIRRTTPARLGSLDPRLRGDLELVFAKALAHDPEQRYASADALADDLQRWLDHRPVHARRPTPLYLLTRFVQRERRLAAVAGTLMLLAVAASAMALQGFRHARAANRELAESLATVVEQFRRSVDDATSLRELPAEIEARLAMLVAQHPGNRELLHAQADWLQMKGDVLRNRGGGAAVRDLRRQHVALRQLLQRPGDPTATHELAIALVLEGDSWKDDHDDDMEALAFAARRYREAHGLFEELHAADPDGRRARDDLAHSFLRIGYVHLLRRDLDAARDPIAASAQLAAGLLRDFPDAIQTHALNRDLLGIATELATRHGTPPPRLPITEQMLGHARAMRRADPDSLHAATQLANAAASFAFESRKHGRLGDASLAIDEGLAAASFVRSHDPAHILATCAQGALLAEGCLTALARRDDLDAVHRASAALHVLSHTSCRDEHAPRTRALRQRILESVVQCLSQLPDEPHLQRLAAAMLPTLRELVLPADSARDLCRARTIAQARLGDTSDRAAARANLARAQQEDWMDASLWVALGFLEAAAEDPDAAHACMAQARSCGCSADDPCLRALRCRLDER